MLNYPRFIARAAILVVFAVLLMSHAPPTTRTANAQGGTTYTFTGNGNWNNPARWSPSYPGTTINSGDTVVIEGGVLITLDIAVVNNGTLTNNGSEFTIRGSLTNTGTLTNNLREFTIEGNLTNTGTLTNNGDIVNERTLLNTGIFTNNRGFQNFSTLINAGILTNNSTFDNYSTNLRNQCTGIINGDITYTDSPLVQETCTVSVDDVTQAEGGVFTFTATLDRGASVDISMDWALENVSTSAADFSGPTSGPITFPAGGSLTQTITIATQNDAVVEGNETFTVRFTSRTPDLATIDISDTATGTITDDDMGSVTASPTSVAVAESGTTAGYAVVLNAPPTGNVVISVSSSDTGEATATPASLTFTPVNWDTPQTVTVTGVDDPLVDGPQNVTISHTAAGGGYDGVTIASVDVTVADDDVPLGAGTLLVAPSSLILVEEDPATGSFFVYLTQPPATGETVTVNLTHDPAQLTVSSSVLTFTDADFSIPQSVTVDAVADGIPDGGVVSPINLTATSSLGGTSPLAGLTAGVLVTIFDTADQLISFVPNLGLVVISTTSPTPLYDGPNGEPLRINQVTMWLPQDEDGNGFDAMQITEIQVINGDIWLGLWLGSGNWAWIIYEADTMQLSDDAYLSIYQAQNP